MTRLRTLLPAAAALFLLASVCAPAQQAGQPSLSPIEGRFYEILARGAASTDLNKTKMRGGGGGGAFAEVCAEGGLLVGFEVWEGEWAGHRIVRGLRPIFQTAGGRVQGASHGHTPGRPHTIVQAKDGYAVAALEVRSGDRLDGFQLLFWKIRPSLGRLDAEGAYKSGWIGGQGGSRARNALSSDGRAVLGIHGAGGADIDRLGLIYLPK